MRLFIAIQVSETVRKSLLSMQENMRAKGIRGTYTKPENLHLTLAFIGEYGDPDSVLDVMEAVPFEPFRIGLDGFGHFGDLWWAGLSGSTELAAYVRRLRRALSEGDIPFDRKKFSPHMTLVRRAVFETKEMPGLYVPKTEMTVRYISLMRSDRGRNGMIYTELGRVPF